MDIPGIEYITVRCRSCGEAGVVDAETMEDHLNERPNIQNIGRLYDYLFCVSEQCDSRDFIIEDSKGKKLVDSSSRRCERKTCRARIANPISEARPERRLCMECTQDGPPERFVPPVPEKYASCPVCFRKDGVKRPTVAKEWPDGGWYICCALYIPYTRSDSRTQCTYCLKNWPGEFPVPPREEAPVIVPVIRPVAVGMTSMTPLESGGDVGAVTEAHAVEAAEPVSQEVEGGIHDCADPEAEENAGAAAGVAEAAVEKGRSGDLFEELRELRLDIAREKGCPAFVIFHDTTLRDMAASEPMTPEEFLAVRGVGPSKLKHYGEQFMEVIKRFSE